MNDQFLFEEDGFFMPDVGSWATTKHQKISYYCSLFSTSMKKKWDCRVYIDLFAGAGKGKIEHTRKIIPGSPLISLSVNDPFDKYIFCEKDTDSIEALKKRINKYFSNKDVSFIEGDINNSVEKMLSVVPKFSKSFKGLSLCFVDPFKKSELSFDTLKFISNNLYVDFLVLIPSYMDIHRNEKIYTRTENISLDKYLGNDIWRERWKVTKKSDTDFGIFIADEFCKQMQSLGYLYEGLNDVELVTKGTVSNLKLYHLAFFSKNKLGLQFWRETKENTRQQLTLC
jgi:three-Cys-motif partner protein